MLDYLRDVSVVTLGVLAGMGMWSLAVCAMDAVDVWLMNRASMLRSKKPLPPIKQRKRR